MICLAEIAEADWVAGGMGALATSEGLLIGETENGRRAVACLLTRTTGVWERRETVEGRTARRHRAIEAIIRREM